MSSLSMLPTCVLVLLTTFLVLRRLLPLFSQAISKHLKIRTISFRSIRGIEWNNNLSSGSKSVLVVKVERVGISFHRGYAHGVKSWISIVVEDVVVTLKTQASLPPLDLSLFRPNSDDSFSSRPPIHNRLPSTMSPPGSPFLYNERPPFSPPSSPPSHMMASLACPDTLSSSPSSPPLAFPSTFHSRKSSYFPPPPHLSARGAFADLKKRTRTVARKLAERLLRSTLSVLPELARVVDIEFRGKMEFTAREEALKVDGEADEESLGLQVSLKGGLRIGTRVELTVPPSRDDDEQRLFGTGFEQEEEHRRRNRPTRLKRAKKGARWLGSSASRVWTRGLGRSQGMGSFVLDIGEVGRIEVRMITGSTESSPKDSPRSSAILSRSRTRTSSSSNTERDASPSRPPRRSGSSFASLSSLVFSTSSTSVFPRYVPLTSQSPNLLFAIDGPVRLRFGHRFGPGVQLIGEEALLVEAGLHGKVSVCANALEDLASERQSSQPSPKKRKTVEQKNILESFQSAKLDLALVVITHTERRFFPSSTRPKFSLDPSDSPPSLSPDTPLAVELIVHDLNVSAQVSHPKESPLHRDWLGSQPEGEGFAIGAGLASLRFSLVTSGCLEEPTSPKTKAPPSTPPVPTTRLELGRMRLDTFASPPPPAPSLSPKDPNDWLVVCEMALDGVVGVAAMEDLELVAAALQAREPRSRPSPLSSPAPKPKPSSPWPIPRFSLVSSLGETSLLLLASPKEGHQSTSIFLTLLGGSFNANGRYSDASKVKAKHNLTGLNIKHSSSKRPQLLQASLDDYSVGFDVETHGCLGPLSIFIRQNSNVQVDRPTPSDKVLLRVQSGELSGRGKVLGFHRIQGRRETLSEVVVLDKDSTMAAFNASLGSVCVEVWDPDVVDGLERLMSELQRLEKAPPPPLPIDSAGPLPLHPSLLRKFPPGITIYSSIALLDLILAAPDPNPDCPKKLLRGVRVRTRLVAEYSFQRAQHASRIPPATSRLRDGLRLPTDIAAQASATAVESDKAGGEAALFSVTTHDLSVLPVLNARQSFERRSRASFDGPGPTASSMFPPAMRRQPTKVSWDFQRAPAAETEGPLDAQTISPFNLSPIQAANTPLLNMAALNIRLRLQSQAVNAKSATRANQINVSIKEVGIRFDLAHVYCCLCAVEAVKHITARPKDSQPPPSSPPSKPRHLAFGVSLFISTVHLYLHFPLGEDLFIRTRNLDVHFPLEGPKCVTVESIFGFVPSLRQKNAPGETARWEELARLRQVRLVLSFAPDHVPSITVILEGARLRIPFSYKLANLILNVSTTVKAVKQLLKIFRESDAGLIVEPKVEGPKSVPDIHFACKTFTFEATDDEIDTKLNLIWRAGHEEHAARMEREEGFEAKVAVIRAYERGEEHHHPSTSRWKFGPKHTVSIEEARAALDQINANLWIKRHRAAVAEQGRREDKSIRKVNGPTKADPRLPISVTPPVRSAPLFRLSFIGVELDIKRPSFEGDGLKDFMHDLGHDLPRSTEFSLLVPLHIRWTMDSAKFSLRDYPIPLLNVPPLTPEQLASTSCANKAWEFETDLVIGEEMAGKDSFYWIPATVIPDNTGEEGAAKFRVMVAKTIMPVKTYAEPKIKIHTSQTTDFCWGTSYQPGIQDMMKVFETLTHPPRDPSERVGFWDKLRLVFHWKLKLDFEGPVHIHAKGSRSPYEVLDHGAGFVLAWSGQPTFTINLPNKERELIQMDADRLVFAIPDLRDLIDRAAMGNSEVKTEEEEAATAADDDAQPRKKREFRKVFAKFTNGARVGWGFVLERTCMEGECQKCGRKKKFDRQCRIWDFKPHYAVVFNTPESVKERGESLDQYDAFKGFRSDYIHFSMSIVSPTNRQRPRKQEVTVDDASGYNAFHFTPKGFAHFFAWWRLFGGNMGLPIRQGKMFPASPPPSKKFGKALATIKYRFDLSPLFISHMYSNDSRADWGRGEGTYLGIKCKVAHFKADLHQREEEKTVTNELLGRTKVIPHKPFYAADVVLDEIDLRATSALFKEPEKRHVKLDPGLSQVDSMFTRPTTLPDPAWFDFDDHVETDWSPTDRHPHIELHKIADCPRFDFVKRTGRNVSNENSPSESQPDESCPTSKFGHEPTHLCILGELKSPTQIQIELCQDRIKEIEGLLGKTPSGSLNHEREKAFERAIVILREQITKLRRQLEKEFCHKPVDESAKFSESSTGDATATSQRVSETLPRPTIGSFDNVYHAQSPKLTWSNEVRNIMLKYYYNSRVRKGFEYHMSSVAVKFIREMTRERPEIPAPPPPRHHHLHPAGSLPPKTKPSKSPSGLSRRGASSAVGAGLLRMFAGDMEPEIVDSEDASSRPTRSYTYLNGRAPKSQPWEGLSDNLTIEKKHCFVLLQPQIALRSNVDDESIVIMAANVVELEMFSVLDKEDLDDPVNARVMRRSYGTMTDLQAFCPSTINDSESGSDFLPLEVMYDTMSVTTDFEKIVPQTNVSLQYDKFNQLRLRNKLRPMLAPGADSELSEHLKHHMDLVALNIPSFQVRATPKHFSAFYNIVTNLLLYQDDLQQERSKRLESFIFSFDHSNLSGTADVVRDLQQRIRSLDRLRATYETNQAQLDAEGRVDLATIRGQTRQLAEELDLIFDAIAAAQDPREDRDQSKKSAVKFEASAGRIEWKLLTPEMGLMAKLGLADSTFHWLSKRDSSVSNNLTIQSLEALNGHPDATFPEILSRYYKPGSTPGAKSDPSLVVKWSLLPPVGGIAIVEHFGLAIHPVRVQLERKVGRDFLAYFFQKDKKKEAAAAKEAETKSAFTGDSPTKATFSVIRPDDSSVMLDSPFDSTPAEITPSSDSPSIEPPQFILSRASSSASFHSSAIAEKGKKPLLRATSSTNLKLSPSSSTPSSTTATPAPSTHKLRRSRSNQSMRSVKETKASKEKADKTQVEEMRSRASSNRTFVYVNVLSTTLVLSYKGDKAKSITNLYDLKFATPPIEYHNRTLSFEELIHEFKGELMKSAWQQRGRLFSQFIKPRPKPSPAPSLGHAAQALARRPKQPSSSEEYRKDGSPLLPDRPLVQSPTNSFIDLPSLASSDPSELTLQTSGSSGSSTPPSKTASSRSSSVSNLLRRTFHRKSVDPRTNRSSSETSINEASDEDAEIDDDSSASPSPTSSAAHPASDIDLRKAILGRASG